MEQEKQEYVAVQIPTEYKPAIQKPDNELLIDIHISAEILNKLDTIERALKLLLKA